jgi:hypothetical protein
LPDCGHARIITAMPLEVLQRRAWNGMPVRLGSMFTVTRGRRSAVCELWTHLLGWELRLTTGATLLQSQVYRAQEDVLGTHETWQAAIIEKGWR